MQTMNALGQYGLRMILVWMDVVIWLRVVCTQMGKDIGSLHRTLYICNKNERRCTLRSLLPVIVKKQITTANNLASTIVEISSFQSTQTGLRLKTWQM